MSDCSKQCSAIKAPRGEDGGWCSRCGLDGFRSIRYDPTAAWRLALFLTGLAVVCAAGGIVGYETGWARFHKDDFEPKTNTYMAIIQTVIEDYPEHAEKIPPGLLDLIAPTLPDGTISIDLKLGWYERHTELLLHTGDLPSMILNFLERPVLDEYRSLIDEVVVEKKIVRVQMYKESDVGGQCSGAIAMAALGISVILALMGHFSYLILQSRSMKLCQKFGHICYSIMHSGFIIGLFIIVACIVHYVVLAYGTHRDTQASPYLERGFIPWPSWAWVSGLLSAAFWMIVGLMSTKGLLPEPVTNSCKSSRIEIEQKGAPAWA